MNILSKINVPVLIFCLLNTSVFSMQEYTERESRWEPQEIYFPTEYTLAPIWYNPEFSQPTGIDFPILEEPELPQQVNTQPTQPIEFIDFNAGLSPDKVTENFVCKWGTCEESFGNLSDFVNHVNAHICKNCVKCEWQGCSYSSACKNNLKRHMRKHAE